MAKHYLLFLIAFGSLLLAGCANVATETNNTTNVSVTKDGVSNTLKMQDVLVSKDGELKVKLLAIEDNHAVILISGYGFQSLDKFKLAAKSNIVVSVNGTKYGIYNERTDVNSADLSIKPTDANPDYSYSDIKTVKLLDARFGSNLIPADNKIYVSIQDVSIDTHKVLVSARSMDGGNLGKISSIGENSSRFVYSDENKKYEIAVLRLYKNSTSNVGQAEISITEAQVSPKYMATTPAEFPTFDDGKIKLFFFINESGEVQLNVADSEMNMVAQKVMREDDAALFSFQNQNYNIKIIEVVTSGPAGPSIYDLFPEILYVKYTINKE